VGEATEPLLVKAPKASARTGLPVATLYEGAAAGRIPHIRVGRSVWFSLAALEAWIRQQANGPRDAD